MPEFLDKVIVPYVKQTRSELQLASDQPALALFDVYKAPSCESVLEKLRQNHIFIKQQDVQGTIVGFN